MNGEWIFQREFGSVTLQVLNFKCPEVELVIQPLKMADDSAVLGCYIPTIPRPTSILSGRLLLYRLPRHRTGLRALDFQSWAAPFLQSLVNSISNQSIV
jgi:hypothetical protein